MSEALHTDTPIFSILIGMVSTEDTDRIIEALESLRQQQGNYRYEVIIADRRNDSVGQLIDQSYPEVKRIGASAGTSLPALRCMALDQASGQYIIVTEDHCVPTENWLDSFAAAFASAPGDTVAVGGCVENGVYDTSLDWATFLCEYSYFLQPVFEGTTPTLPGMNVAYRRDIFEKIDRSILTSGFWETTLHPRLIESGGSLFSSNRIKLFHSKKFSLWLFTKQRFIYSRYYAGLRFQPSQWLHRISACCASILLPPLLLYRMIKQIRQKNRLRKELFSATPYLALFILVWALGEMWGYLFGKGGALEAIE